MTLHFTVAIPTYNGALRLPKVLARLQAQIKTENLNWEVLIVDNNSQDNTAAVVKTYIENSENRPFPFALRYCFEPRQGLAFARQRAVEEAKGNLVGFLDDDNLPASDWVAAAVTFDEGNPSVGAFGGQIHGRFDKEPPPNFKRIQSFLAIREGDTRPRPFKPLVLDLPAGAGMVIRRQAWLSSVPKELVLIGRVSGSSLAGEDFEALLHLHRAGWAIWYNPQMHLEHEISVHRLTKDYLLSTVRGAGLCIFHLRLVNSKRWERPLLFARVVSGNLKRLILHIAKYGMRSRGDMVTACELEFVWSSLVSPFYYLKTQISRR
ncbi:hormogonium polysaccharide biosynthesis glycosyltransferase HpsE [Leptolyngbya sp. FACHB-261]|uniref:hormogonium polysaccharide biosynthesis glycosyltransferase HpsE n=1 Tax=Leptolyngbya sp. FACHB-261 TaxID=2692806 RepID=UPI0016891F6E|nr:hormogonium polysaccharide biosynthesis glycosyltransferase HpsE [Leptolyngbya sp. FACHB-261]MBD2103815.1 glycosyltransferase family 2 protein [Leptolyngbya sp. FACHB-261]